MTTGSTPSNSMTTAPSTNPTAVPATARNTRVPVVSALLRNTDIAPSTTQNPCSTGKHMRDRDRERQAETRAQAVAQHHRPGGQEPLGDGGDRDGFRHDPIGGTGLRKPTAQHPRPHRAGVRGRGVADHPAGHRDGGRNGAAAQQLATHLDRRGIVGLARAFSMMSSR